MKDMADDIDEVTEEPVATEQVAPEAEEVAAVDGDDQDELVVTFGEEPPPPVDEEKAAPEWVRNLRKENREAKRKIKELESKLVAPAPEAQKLGPKPTLEGAEYDADRFERELLQWNEAKRKHEADQAALRAEQEAQDKVWQDRVQSYQGAKASLKVRDFDDAEDTVKEALTITQQGIILQGAKDPALLVYALGKSPEKAKELAAIKDPVQFTFAVARMEMTVKATPRKPASTPETTVTGNGRPSGAMGVDMEKLRQQSEKTGNWDDYFAAKRRLAAKQK
jgi:hypothetical protein